MHCPGVIRPNKAVNRSGGRRVFANPRILAAALLPWSLFRSDDPTGSQRWYHKTLSGSRNCLKNSKQGLTPLDAPELRRVDATDINVGR